VIALAAAVLLAGGLFAVDVPRAWRVALFLPFWISALGFFQARDKT
jgi:hypothetical protein